MSTNVDGENSKHIPEKRLIELSKGTGEAISQEEKAHLANCDRCHRLLGALFRLERGDY